VALSGDDPPIVVIGELKLTFNLELILQAVDRAAAADEVWLAAKLSARGKGRESDARYRNLCRRLGFGMLAVTKYRRRRGDRQTADAAPRRTQEALAAGRGASRRKAIRRWWFTRRADHDRLSATGAGLRVALSGGPGA